MDSELISLFRPGLAGWGINVKFIAVLTALCTFSGAAIAQGSPCQSIAKASDRLACYDKAAPPIALAKPAASKTPAAPAKLADLPDVDLFSARAMSSDLLAAEKRETGCQAQDPSAAAAEPRCAAPARAFQNTGGLPFSPLLPPCFADVRFRQRTRSKNGTYLCRPDAAPRIPSPPPLALRRSRRRS
jgi:hypothetical protein